MHGTKATSFTSITTSESMIINIYVLNLKIALFFNQKNRLFDHWVLGVLNLGFLPAYTTKFDLPIL